MAEQWPTSLDQKVQADNFQLEKGKTSISSENDYGPPKKRNRVTKGNDQISVSFFLESQAEYNTWDAFYETTLANGVKTFIFEHPAKGVDTEFQIIGEPSIRYVGGNAWTVNMEWREIN